MNVKEFVKEYFNVPLVKRYKIILTNGQSIRLHCSEAGIIEVATAIIQNKELNIESILVTDISPKLKFIVENYQELDISNRVVKTVYETEFQLPRNAVRQNPKIYQQNLFRISVLLDNLEIRIRNHEAIDIYNVIRRVNKGNPMVVYIWKKQFLSKGKWIFATKKEGFSDFNLTDEAVLKYSRLQWNIPLLNLRG